MSNPLIARRIDAMEGYAPGEQPSSPGVIKLNTNENPYPPSPKVAEAIASFDAESLRRYPDPAAAALRARIAGIHGCEPEQVFAGNGSDEILALATRAFVQDGGTVASFSPTYSLYPVLAQIRGAAYDPLPLAPGFLWRDPPAGFRADLFLLANPNAPTSVMYDKAKVRAFCESFPGVVLIDEAYVDFARASCMDLAAAPGNRNVIVSRTLSKSFSLAGLRLGYCVGPAELVGALDKIKDSYNLDGLAQAAAIAALDDPGWMRANAAKIIATRARCAAELRRRGWTLPESGANFLFARPPDGQAKRRFDALRARNIFVRHFPAPETAEYLRISIGADWQMERLLAELG